MVFRKEDWTIPTPYGVISFATLIVTLLAYILFNVAAFHCFLTVSKTLEYEIYIGYWGRESPDYATGVEDDNNYCIQWNSTSKKQLFDGLWRFGKFLGVFGTMVGIPLVLALVYILCCRLPTRVFVAMVAVDVYMAISSLLLLVGLGSDVCKLESCKIGPGGFIAIFDFFIWLAAAFLAFRLLERSRELDRQQETDPEPEKETYPALPMSENFAGKQHRDPESGSKKEEFPALPMSENYAKHRDVEAPGAIVEYQPPKKNNNKKENSTGKKKTKSKK